MAAVVAPVLHLYVPPPLAVNLLLVVEQVSVVAVAEMLADGAVVFDDIVLLSVSVQPFDAVTVTV